MPVPPLAIPPLEGAPLPTLLSRPAAPDAVTPAPVLCFLHGYDEAAPLPIAQALTRHGPLAPTAWPPVRERWLVVAPQLPAAGDIWHRHSAAVVEIVRRVLREHGGDPARTFLTGFSFGGNGVFDVALRQPALWRALWAVDPTRPPVADPRCPVWLSAGAIARQQGARFVRALGLRDVAAAGVEGDRLYLDEGEDHVGSARCAYADEQIYRWLERVAASSDA